MGVILRATSTTTVSKIHRVGMIIDKVGTISKSTPSTTIIDEGIVVLTEVEVTVIPQLTRHLVGTAAHPSILLRSPSRISPAVNMHTMTAV